MNMCSHQLHNTKHTKWSSLSFIRCSLLDSGFKSAIYIIYRWWKPLMNLNCYSDSVLTRELLITCDIHSLLTPPPFSDMPNANCMCGCCTQWVSTEKKNNKLMSKHPHTGQHAWCDFLKHCFTHFLTVQVVKNTESSSHWMETWWQFIEVTFMLYVFILVKHPSQVRRLSQTSTCATALF